MNRKFWSEYVQVPIIDFCLDGNWGSPPFPMPIVESVTTIGEDSIFPVAFSGEGTNHLREADGQPEAGCFPLS
ncbi:unnamed protein product [Prunus armeniaca]|uniref:Uncharacterized protein n=1 Tax=Prunus armeniaca TaxID=36596 RepID=A0A6J5UGS8_PRUAR|nr:unnamed protein product [Prunus armeniaca]